MNGTPQAFEANPASESRHSPNAWPLLCSLAGTLLLAVLFQFLPGPAPKTPNRVLPLEEFFPMSLSGWIGEDLPLGETEAVSDKTRRLLRFDEAFQRAYRKNGAEFVLYVAYWKAGRMPARDVAFHTPDQCWTSVGWKRTSADYAYRMKLNDRELAPGQLREFASFEDHQYVLYWHVLNGETIVYSPDRPPTQIETIRSLLRHGVTHKGEQYFLRLSSRVPPDQLCRDEGFKALMELLATLGPGLGGKA